MYAYNSPRNCNCGCAPLSRLAPFPPPPPYPPPPPRCPVPPPRYGPPHPPPPRCPLPLATGIIKIQLRLHVIKNATMNRKGQALDMWLTGTETSFLSREINRIWSQAGIYFESSTSFEFCKTDPTSLYGIANSTRDNKEETNMKLINLPLEYRENAINVYFFPFIGSTRQGFAPPYKKFPGYVTKDNASVFVGVWSDKASGGRQPPQRQQIYEPEPFRIGSLSRTVAHEIGHLLGLPHPRDGNIPRLMGGPVFGYKLTPQEVKISRAFAARFATLNV